MSHTTSIASIQITNIQALRMAVQELAQQGIKIALVEGATPRAFYPDQNGMGKADYVVQLGGACRYDIGLYKNKTGGYDARTDFWGGDVEKVLGAPASSPQATTQARLGKLFQAYGLNAATIEARKKGYTVSRVAQADGTVQLKMMVPN